MDLLAVRREIAQGKSLYDLPLRVTFYARVSTDKEEQRSSLEHQVQYYTAFIQEKPQWTLVPGYIDEGLSGTSACRRDSFLRMIRDGAAGRFDFIITKEISRFSRSTLDSIRYTRELLDHNVGVLFQNDNINTVDPDSEFRLTIMAGVAQDEVRKLSQRLKFGFRQAVKNGRVLGNSQLWGYDKKDCVLTVNQREAQAVRQIFRLYALEGLGIRKISQRLTQQGFTSRQGGPFNELTIRHILQNPKYKGWYCGGKSQTVDYRSKRKVQLEESQWTTYRDPAIPALVSEELWDRANALYKRRSREMKARQQGAEYHRRYPYSGKIRCGLHGCSFHRRQQGEREVWECREYRRKGRAGCSLPRLETRELDRALAQLFPQVFPQPDVLRQAVLQALEEAAGLGDLPGELLALERQREALGSKKDRLLELSLAGALSPEEFKTWNSQLNGQLETLAGRRRELLLERDRRSLSPAQRRQVEEALSQELRFETEDPSPLAASVLEGAVVLPGQEGAALELELTLTGGSRWRASLFREQGSFRFTPFLRCAPPDAGCAR